MLSTPSHVRGAADHRAVLVVDLFLGKLPCPKVRALSSDSLSAAPGCEEEHSKGKDQSLVSVEEQSQPARNQPSALPSDRAAEFIVLLSW